jgi:lipid A disaccharide synthetase
MVCPELLQMDCNPKELAKMISLLLTDSELKVKMAYDLQTLNQHLVRSKDEKLEDTVLRLLAQNQST